MSERFERVFSLSKNMYSAGAPILISAGALLKDMETNKVLAQLKFKNISEKPVKAVKVIINPLDTAGKSLGEAVSFDYLDLCSQRDVEFGQKIAVPIPNSSTRAFTVNIAEVVFDDNSTWTSSQNTWTPLPESKLLEEALGDPELAKQFRLQFSEKALYQPVVADEAWLCTCGAFNYTEEETCHACGNDRNKLFSCNLEELKKETAERLKIEKEQNDQKQEKNKKKKKRLIIAAILAVALIIGISIPVSSLVKQKKAEQIAALAEEYLAKRDYYGALCLYAENDNTDGVKSVLRRMSCSGAKRVIIGSNKTLLLWTGTTVSQVDGATGKIIYTISPVYESEIDSYCKVVFKNTTVKYDINLS